MTQVLSWFMSGFSIPVFPLPTVVYVWLKCGTHTLDTGLVRFGIQVLFGRFRRVMGHHGVSLWVSSSGPCPHSGTSSHFPSTFVLLCTSVLGGFPVGLEYCSQRTLPLRKVLQDSPSALTLSPFQWVSKPLKIKGTQVGTLVSRNSRGGVWFCWRH